MPLPLAPIAGIALRYGAVALATYTVARRTVRKVEPGRRDQRAEDSHDDLPEGMTLRREAEQANATGRFKRKITLGKSGSSYEIDASALTRIRVRKL